MTYKTRADLTEAAGKVQREVDALWLARIAIAISLVALLVSVLKP